VTLASSLLVLLFWTFSTTTNAALAFVILFGMVSGAVIGLPPASVADILGHCPTQQAKLGQWTGMVYSIAAPFALAGPVIGGYLMTKYKTFLAIQLWSGGCLFLSGMFMIGAIYSKRLEQKAIKTKKEIMAESTTISEAVTRQPSQNDLTMATHKNERQEAG